MSSILCIRDPLTEEMTPRNLQIPRSATHDHFCLPREYSPIKTDRSSILSPVRNRPHSLHVKPVFGVSGSTVCAVQEPVFPPRKMSPLSGRDLTCKLTPQLSTRYSANRAKSEAAVGIIPVTYEWKGKLLTDSSNLVPPTPLEVPPVEPLQTQKVAFKGQKSVISNDRQKKQQILLQVLDKAGNSGIKRNKLPTLFSYLARNNDSLDKAAKNTSLRKQGLPKINKHNHLRFSRHALPHHL